MALTTSLALKFDLLFSWAIGSKGRICERAHETKYWYNVSLPELILDSVDGTAAVAETARGASLKAPQARERQCRGRGTN